MSFLKDLKISTAGRRFRKSDINKHMWDACDDIKKTGHDFCHYWQGWVAMMQRIFDSGESVWTQERGKTGKRKLSTVIRGRVWGVSCCLVMSIDARYVRTFFRDSSF